jgi:hypothetical protein
MGFEYFMIAVGPAFARPVRILSNPSRREY